MTYEVKIKRQGVLIRTVEAIAEDAVGAMDWVEANLRRFIPEAKYQEPPCVSIDKADGSMVVSRWHGYEFTARVNNG